MRTQHGTWKTLSCLSLHGLLTSMGRRGPKGKKTSAEAYRELLAAHMASSQVGQRRVTKRPEARLEAQRLQVAHSRLDSMQDMFSSRGARNFVRPLLARGGGGREVPSGSSWSRGSHGSRGSHWGRDSHWGRGSHQDRGYSSQSIQPSSSLLVTGPDTRYDTE